MRRRPPARRARGRRLFATNDFRSGSGVRCYRYDKLVELMAAARAPLRPEDVERLLDEVDLDDINVQCMVFIPERREMRLSLGRIPAARGPFVVLKPWE